MLLLLSGLPSRDRSVSPERRALLVVGLRKGWPQSVQGRHVPGLSRSYPGSISTWAFCLPFCGFWLENLPGEGEASIFLLLNGEDIS